MWAWHLRSDPHFILFFTASKIEGDPRLILGCKETKQLMLRMVVNEMKKGLSAVDSLNFVGVRQAMRNPHRTHFVEEKIIHENASHSLLAQTERLRNARQVGFRLSFNKFINSRNVLHSSLGNRATSMRQVEHRLSLSTDKFFVPLVHK